MPFKFKGTSRKPGDDIPTHTERHTHLTDNPEGIVDNRQKYDPNYSAMGPGATNPQGYNTNSAPYHPAAGEANRPYDPNSFNPQPATGLDSHYPTGPNAHTHERSSHLGNEATPAGGVPGVATAHTRGPGNPSTNVSLVDKVIGLTEEMVGRVTGNRERVERGQLREMGGVAAVHSADRRPRA